MRKAKNQSENLNKEQTATIKTKKPRTKKDAELNGSYVEDEALAPFVGAMFRSILDAEEDRQIVIVCFGTATISGDSLGPTVGKILREECNISAFVYGTEEHSVNGKNMGEWLDFIKTVHEGALFIAVDASLGANDKVGQVILRTDGVCPAAIKGKTNRFGDIGILGVVAQNSKDPLMQLMTVSPLYVSDLAYKIAFMLKSALDCA